MSNTNKTAIVFYLITTQINAHYPNYQIVEAHGHLWAFPIMENESYSREKKMMLTEESVHGWTIKLFNFSPKAVTFFLPKNCYRKTEPKKNHFML